jgi:hypothetical protein
MHFVNEPSRTVSPCCRGGEYATISIDFRHAASGNFPNYFNDFFKCVRVGYIGLHEGVVVNTIGLDRAISTVVNCVHRTFVVGDLMSRTAISGLGSAGLIAQK